MNLPLYLIIIPFFPLLSFVFTITFGKKLGQKSHILPIVAVLTSAFCSLIAFNQVLHGVNINQDLYSWFISGKFKASVGFQLDELTAVMLIVVTSISSLVHIYSVGYMHNDPGYYRFFAYLSLFTFSMLMLVLGNNFLQLYFGWEAVGLSSYLLIGFWYHKKSASDAGKKAFIVNRFGDFGFGLGIIVVFLTFGTIHYAEVFSQVNQVVGKSFHFIGMDIDVITLMAVLLFCGAIGKSAQIPLHVWLPDAMEGPTPVSALIHAATMVTAGVFLVARCNPIFSLSPFAMNLVTIIGALTCFFAATIALVQVDIKRVIAYSTVSQLAYMFIACGVGAYGAGIFHLYTHAYFKALLFLGAGSVIHAMSDEQDIRKMGGLKKYLPVTYFTFLMASLSISGIPPFAGFFSKDEILAMAFASHIGSGKFAWFIGTIVAAMTAFYSFRLLFLTFHGEFRGTKDQKEHLHESPFSMTIPLALLALGSVVAGWVGVPEFLGGSNGWEHFLSKTVGHPEVHLAHSTEWILMCISVSAGIFGIMLARYMYIQNPQVPLRLAERFNSLYTVLFNKYYVDEFYSAVIVRPTLTCAQKVLRGFTDKKIIEGVVNGIPSLIGKLSLIFSKAQTGRVQQYAAVMAIGTFFLLLIFM